MKSKPKIRRVKAWTVVSETREVLGSGQRGRHYIYWDEKDAREYLKKAESGVPVYLPLNWQVIRCEITYQLPPTPVKKKSGK